jgi:hypothetical protein
MHRAKGCTVGAFKTDFFVCFGTEFPPHILVLFPLLFFFLQTNRFVRHEIKNGLLAGIELCDSLRNQIDSIANAYRTQKQVLSTMIKSNSLPDLLDGSSRSTFSVDDSNRSILEEDAAAADINTSRNRVSDLDLLLHEVLETVLHEAMARDVVVSAANILGVRFVAKRNSMRG